MARLRNIFFLLLGVIALPLLIFLNFRVMKDFAKSLFKGLTDVSLADSEFRDRIAFEKISATPSMKRRAAVKKECVALAKAGDWRTLSDRIMSWDQARSKCDAGYPLAEVGLRAVLYHLAEGVVEGHDCHPDPIAILSDDVALRLETLAAKHPESYPLLALAAETRCYQGWCYRGADYARYVSDDGWFGMAEHFSKAAWLLDKFDPVGMNSPLLAAARHRLLGFMPDADKRVAQFYDEWSALDPADQQPHEKHAIMILPRWFGSEQTIEIEARRAAGRTGSATGDAAYFTIYRRVFNVWDPAVLLLDIGMLRRGVNDLVTMRNEDPAFVAELFQEMRWCTAMGSDRFYSGEQRKHWTDLAAGIDDIRRDLLLSRLTAICPRVWEGKVDDALGSLSAYIQEDIKAGATFELGAGGLKVIPPDVAREPRTV